MAEPGPQAGTDALDDEPEGPDEGQPGLVAFRPRREPAPSHGEVDDATEIADAATEAAQAGRSSGGWTRRLPGGNSLPPGRSARGELPREPAVSRRGRIEPTSRTWPPNWPDGLLASCRVRRHTAVCRVPRAALTTRISAEHPAGPYR